MKNENETSKREWNREKWNEKWKLNRVTKIDRPPPLFFFIFNINFTKNWLKDKLIIVSKLIVRFSGGKISINYKIKSRIKRLEETREIDDSIIISWNYHSDYRLEYSVPCSFISPLSRKEIKIGPDVDTLPESDIGLPSWYIGTEKNWRRLFARNDTINIPVIVLSSVEDRYREYLSISIR